jgi:hypothetical protein
MPHLLSDTRAKLLCIIAFGAGVILLGAYTTYAGGGGGSGGSGSGSSSRAQPGTHATTNDRALANSVARDMNSRPNSMCSGCSATVTSNRDGSVSVSVRENDRGGGGNNSSSPGTTVTTPTTCTNKNLTTIDVFFVPAGAQPVTTPARTIISGGTRPSERERRVIPASTSYTPIIVPRNELEVGVRYEPIAQIRNQASCSSNSSGFGRDHYEGANSRTDIFQLIPRAHAGGGSNATSPRRPDDYPNNVRTQAPFGSNGSFPVRARIDLGNNTTYEWVEYANSVGPLGNGQSIYLRFPSFTTTEVGNHTIQIVTDIRHSVDPGRGCYASTTPESAGWGCVRETSERDNDRSEAFTTIASTTSYRLTVDATDITVPPGESLDEIPFAVTNAGNAIIRDYRYRVTIAGGEYASTTRITSLTPGSRETVNSNGSYTVPTTPTTLPLRICARVATSTESCDDARIIVATPQCSDRNDNDSDGLNNADDPGCYTDPSNPSTYNPNDNSESDLAALPPPTIVLTARPDIVRYGDTATLEYTVTAAYPIVCTLTGGGESQSVTHTPPSTTGSFVTRPLQSTVTFTLSCSPNIIGVPSTPTAVSETVQVIPLAQET